MKTALFKLGISFTPREVGEHLVSVKKRNVLVPGAPFRIKVGENEVGNANKVKLTGAGLERAKTQLFNEFVVNTKQAGEFPVIFLCFKLFFAKNCHLFRWFFHLIYRQLSAIINLNVEFISFTNRDIIILKLVVINISNTRNMFVFKYVI